MENKKLAVGVIVIIAIVGVAAYSASGNGKEEGTGGTTGGGESTIPEGPIKIGIPTPLSGGATVLTPHGQWYANTICQYINEEENGILGREVEPVIYDTKYEGSTVAEIFSKMVNQDKVEAIVGCMSTSSGLAVAEKIEDEYKIPTIFAEVGTQKLFSETIPNPKYIFRMEHSDMGMATTPARAMLDYKPDLETIAIVTPDYGWGRTQARVFTKAMNSLAPNVKIVNTAYTPVLQANADFSSQISKIKSLNPDAYITWVFGSDLVAFNNQAMEMGLYDKIDLCVNPLQGVASQTSIVKELPKGLVVEARASRGLHPPLEYGYPNSWLVKKALKKYGVLPDYHKIHLMSGLMYLEKAYEKAYEITGEYPSSEQVAETLEGLGMFGPGGVQCIVDHQSTMPCYIYGRITKEDGGWVIKDKKFYRASEWMVPPWMTVDEYIDNLQR